MAEDHLPTHSSLCRSNFALALLLFVIMNAVLFGGVSKQPDKLGQTSYPPDDQLAGVKKPWSWWISRAYLKEKKTPDVVLFGSSQIGSAMFAADAKLLRRSLDCLLHRRAAYLEDRLSKQLRGPVSVFSCALGGEMVSDAYMISQALFATGKIPQVVIIGISPRDFIDNSLQAPSATEPFRFFSNYVELGDMASNAFTDLVSRLEWELNKDLPLRQLQRHCQRLTRQEPAEAQASRAGNKLLNAVSNSSGDVAVGEWVIPCEMGFIFQDNTREYMHRYQNANPPLYESEVAFFNRFLSSMQASGIKTLVVGMPSLAPNRALLPDDFWAKFRAMAFESCRRNGASWIDLSNRDDLFAVDDYLDTVHLNAQGGGKLFRVMAEAAAKDYSIASRLKARHSASL